MNTLPVTHHTESPALQQSPTPTQAESVAPSARRVERRKIERRNPQGAPEIASWVRPAKQKWRTVLVLNCISTTLMILPLAGLHPGVPAICVPLLILYALRLDPHPFQMPANARANLEIMQKLELRLRWRDIAHLGRVMEAQSSLLYPHQIKRIGAYMDSLAAPINSKIAERKIRRIAESGARGNA